MSSIQPKKISLPSNKKALESVNPGSMRVLLVDDDHTTVLVVNRMLEALGFWAHAVNSGAAARECISQSGYDLLVSDLQMPDVDGYTLSSLLKQKSQSTKVIIMTGLGTADVAGYMNTGIVDGWLFKPFSMSELSSAILKCTLTETPDLSSSSRRNGYAADALRGSHLN